MYRPNKGDKCIVRLPSSGQWIESKIHMIDEDTVCHKPDGWPVQIDLIKCVDFRPLKSKRDECIEEIEKVLMPCGGWVEPSVALYNNGYRKQMPYDEFVSTIRDYLYFDLACGEDSDIYAKEIAAKLNRTPDEE